VKISITLALALLLSGCGSEEPEEATDAVVWNTLNGEPTLVIAHRGASAHLPGHTLEAYKLAIDQGADYIEPDLVLTKDDVLICRHDRYLSGTTNVSDIEKFADRKTEKDGREDWWAEDFTLAEIKTLRSRQNYAHRSQEYDDKFGIPSFDEVIELVKHSRLESGRNIGIYPEPKNAREYQALGKDIVTALAVSLARAGWDGADAPVIVQSFEQPALEALNNLLDVKLVQLTLSKTYFDENAPHESFIDLETIPAYAEGVGPDRHLVIHEDGTVTNLVADAHALGLEVHVWTLMGDKNSPDGLSPVDETRRLYDLGVDAVFADDPEQALAVRAAR
jgi:glycerophosphoryl diester phosphodiesterase